jgi:hypothetical protein
VECLQTIQVGKKYAQSIAISYLPNTSVPVMAVGSTDNRISIYVMQSMQVRSSLLYFYIRCVQEHRETDLGGYKKIGY